MPSPWAETFLARRLDTLQRALQGAGAGRPLPYALIENSSKCNTNDSGEKVLPNGSVWLPRLMQKVRAPWSLRAQRCMETVPHEQRAVHLIFFWCQTARRRWRPPGF